MFRVQVMVAVYNHNRNSWFFFLIFIVIVTWFLMNLFSGVVMDKYEKVEQQFATQSVRESEYNLWMAFQLLDEDGSGQLNREELFAVMSELRKAALVSDLPQIEVCCCSSCECMNRATLKVTRALSPNTDMDTGCPSTDACC